MSRDLPFECVNQALEVSSLIKGYTLVLADAGSHAVRQGAMCGAQVLV